MLTPCKVLLGSELLIAFWQLCTLICVLDLPGHTASKAQAHENHHRHHEEEKDGIGFSMTLLFTASLSNAFKDAQSISAWFSLSPCFVTLECHIALRLLPSVSPKVLRNLCLSPSFEIADILMQLVLLSPGLSYIALFLRFGMSILLESYARQSR